MGTEASSWNFRNAFADESPQRDVRDDVEVVPTNLNNLLRQRLPPLQRQLSKSFGRF